MSSDEPFQHLTSDDLRMLRSVLSQAGLDHASLAGNERLFRAAASLAIKHFQAGQVARGDLLLELEMRFGRRRQVVRSRSQYAIQGLPADLQR